MILVFKSRYKGNTIVVKPSKWSKDEKRLTEHASAIRFERHVALLDTVKDKEKIIALASREDFLNSKPSMAAYWPEDIEGFNKFAAENGIELIDSKPPAEIVKIAEYKQPVIQGQIISRIENSEEPPAKKVEELQAAFIPEYNDKVSSIESEMDLFQDSTETADLKAVKRAKKAKS